MNTTFKVTVAVALLATLVYAGPRHGGKGGGPHKCSLIESLELSETQRSEMATLSDEMRTNIEALTPTVPLLEAIDSDGNYDATAYTDAAQSNVTAFIEIEANYVESFLNVLDDEQRSTYLEGLADLNASEARHCSLVRLHP